MLFIYRTSKLNGLQVQGWIFSVFFVCNSKGKYLYFLPAAKNLQGEVRSSICVWELKKKLPMESERERIILKLGWKIHVDLFLMDFAGGSKKKQKNLWVGAGRNIIFSFNESKTDLCRTEKLIPHRSLDLEAPQWAILPLRVHTLLF